MSCIDCQDSAYSASRELSCDLQEITSAKEHQMRYQHLFEEWTRPTGVARAMVFVATKSTDEQRGRSRHEWKQQQAAAPAAVRATTSKSNNKNHDDDDNKLSR